MENKELSIMTIRGENYNIVDASSREAISIIKRDLQRLSNMLDIYKAGILEIAQQLTNLKQDEITKRSNIECSEISSLPVLKFDKNFSILVDITIIKGNELYSSQQIIKHYNGQTYRKVLDSNYVVDCYLQEKDSTIYLFFDTPLENYNLTFNIISYDGNIPETIFDKNKFATDIYSNALKIK